MHMCVHVNITLYVLFFAQHMLDPSIFIILLAALKLLVYYKKLFSFCLNVRMYYKIFHHCKYLHVGIHTCISLNLSTHY